MPENCGTDARAERERMRRFLRGETDERVFTHRAPHAARAGGFCPCERSLWRRIRLCIRGWRMETTLRLPFNAPKVRLLRRLGARIGRNVHIAPGVWIDPLYPQLLTIEDEALVGVGARLCLHEIRQDEFRLGRIALRRGAIVGGFATVGCGVEIGEGATVAIGAVVRRDVPAGATAVGNPARVVSGGKGPPAGAARAPGEGEAAE